MGEPRELSRTECERLLRSRPVGRVALCLPDGPVVVPVNYGVVDGSVVFRTTPYSVVGTYARNAKIAFQVDELDVAREQGWSVLARGRAVVVTAPEEIAAIRAAWSGTPWADGVRSLYFRMPLTELTGRSLHPVEDVTAAANAEPALPRP